MNESITVTREQVEGVMLDWLKSDGVACFDNDDFRREVIKSFTTALFNNVKVGGGESLEGQVLALREALHGAYEELDWAIGCRVEHAPDCITWPLGSRWSDEHPCDCGYDMHTEHIQRLLNEYRDDTADTHVKGGEEGETG